MVPVLIQKGGKILFLLFAMKIYDTQGLSTAMQPPTMYGGLGGTKRYVDLGFCLVD